MELVHEFTFTAPLAPPVSVGPGPFEERTFFEVTGGKVTGQRIKGAVRTGGGDWILAHDDAFGRLDVRAIFETDDGTNIYVQYYGVIEYTPATMAAVSGERQPGTRITTSAPPCGWRPAIPATGEPDGVRWRGPHRSRPDRRVPDLPGDLSTAEGQTLAERSGIVDSLYHRADFSWLLGGLLMQGSGRGGRIVRFAVGAAMFAAAGAVVQAAPATGQAVDCLSLTPGTSASVNRSNIQNCLTSGGKAYLNAGTYPVDSGIRIPAGARLLDRGAVVTGGTVTWPTLRLQPPSGPASTNFLVRFDGSDARVAFLTLNGNRRLHPENGSVVHFLNGNNSSLDNNHITGGDIGGAVGGVGAEGQPGVYFICDTCSGNVAYNNNIYGNFHGVIFHTRKADGRAPNVARNNRIHDIECDSATFSSGGGYGVLERNTIWEAGWYCGNAIPGGGIYSLENEAGGQVIGNTVYDTCGYHLDLHRVANFNANGAPAFSDLPAGTNTALAFMLGYSADAPSWPTTGNFLERNQFRAACSSPYLGVGFFTSRHTGYAADRTWSTSTTNYFTDNRVFGSNYGSRRGGGNWFAGSTPPTTCTATSSPSPCNDDDHQHNPPVGNDYRNDVGYQYY